MTASHTLPQNRDDLTLPGLSDLCKGGAAQAASCYITNENFQQRRAPEFATARGAQRMGEERCDAG
jgi:hypothetical protein